MPDEQPEKSVIIDVDQKLEEIDAFLKEVDVRRKALAKQRAEIGISPKQVKQLLARIPAAHRKAAVEQAIKDFGLELDEDYLNYLDFKENPKALSTPSKNVPPQMKKSLKMFNRRKFSI